MPEYITALLNGVQTKIAAIEATRQGQSGIWHQIVVPHQMNRQDTYTTQVAGTSIDTSTLPCNRFAIQVKGTGAIPTSWTVVLEGSLNGTDFTPIMTHQSGVNGDGEMLWSPVPTVAKYFRSRVTQLTLNTATNIKVDIIGEAGT